MGLLQAASKPHFLERIAKVQPDSSRLWGELDPAGMMAHLRRSIEISLGEVEVEDISNFFMRTAGKVAILYLLPWPKGKIKAPSEFTPPPEGDLDAERARLSEAMDRFLEALTNEPTRRTRNPAMGMLTLKTWSRVHGLHFDHHLRQFGA